MVVIDWLQTCEFVRVNSERFILYCLCGCFIGIIIILLAILIHLYIENRLKIESNRSDTESDDTPSYLPVYHYDGRNHNSFYHI